MKGKQVIRFKAVNSVESANSLVLVSLLLICFFHFFVFHSVLQYLTIFISQNDKWEHKPTSQNEFLSIYSWLANVSLKTLKNSNFWRTLLLLGPDKEMFFLPSSTLYRISAPLLSWKFIGVTTNPKRLKQCMLITASDSKLSNIQASLLMLKRQNPKFEMNS